jgi:hypothetical protein
MFGVDSPYVAGELTPHLMLLGDYAHNPLVLRASPSDMTVGTVVGDQLLMHLDGSFSLWNRLAVNVDVPDGTCEHAGGCKVDADCPAGDWCTPASFSCVPRLGNGAPVPDVPGHAPPLTGACTPAAGLSVCTSGQAAERRAAAGDAVERRDLLGGRGPARVHVGRLRPQRQHLRARDGRRPLRRERPVPQPAVRSGDAHVRRLHRGLHLRRGRLLHERRRVHAQAAGRRVV